MLNLLKHPLLTHKLTQLRRKETVTKDFRETLAEIAGLMAYEITRDLPVRDIIIETPLGKCAHSGTGNGCCSDTGTQGRAWNG